MALTSSEWGYVRPHEEYLKCHTFGCRHTACVWVQVESGYPRIVSFRCATCMIRQEWVAYE